MVMPSSEAINLTNQTITIQDGQALEQEVSLTERAIRSAAGAQQYRVRYNATLIGNPAGDPNTITTLTPLQQQYYNAFRLAGYFVNRDSDTGYWLISWNVGGPESLVTIYILYTSLTPGAIEEQTVDGINRYFDSISPKATSRANLIDPPGTGGDINEASFGASPSTFYQYIAVVTQPTEEDHSAALQDWIIAMGLGYHNAPGANIKVYKVA